MATNKIQSGFSLVELIVVIVVLGVISAGTAIYIVRSMEAYSATVRRDQLTSTARAAVERMVRELRNALPNSIRVDNSGGTHCLEFLPIDQGSSYQSIPLTAANVSFSAVPYSTPNASTAYVVVYPYNTQTLYAKNNPGPVADYDNATSNPGAGEVYLAGGGHRFTQSSPRKRFFITGPPVSYCVTPTGDLQRYQGYSINSNQPVPPAGTPALLAEGVQLNDGGSAITPFSYSPGSLQRSGVVTLDLRFMQDNEWVRLLHEVQIRNAP